MNKRLHYLMLIFCLALTWTFLTSNSSNPPNGRTGAPGDGLCSDCHGGNNPNNFDGGVSFEGLPATIEPNTTYPITITVSNPNGAATRAGFQWVALNESENNAGSMANDGANSNIVSAGGRSYHEHGPAQFFAGDTELSWTVDWTSPDAGTEDETITFYGVGLIANGGGTAGDLVTTSSINTTLPAASVPLTATISAQTDVSCNGASDGSATVTAQGGQEPYTYLWSNGETTATATNLADGMIAVTVTDAANATIDASTMITEPAALQSQVAVTDVSCNGASNGSFTVVVTGGTPPYSFQGATTDVPAGTYTIMVTDANGCELQVSATVNEPPVLEIEILEVVPTACFDTMDGSITYQVSGGNLDADTIITISDLGTGVFPITVTDANGCFAEEEALIEGPTEIVITVDEVLGESNGMNGAIFITVEGGTPDYIYEWFKDGNLIATSEDVEGLQGGDYTLVVLDANNCEQTIDVTVEFILAANQIDGLENLSIFPNPTTDQLFINFNYLGKDQLQLQLLDARGRVLQSQSAFANNTMKVAEYPSGLYFVRITNGRASAVEKVIIE